MTMIQIDQAHAIFFKCLFLNNALENAKCRLNIINTSVTEFIMILHFFGFLLK